MASVLSVKGLSKSFGSLRVLQSVNLEVSETGVHSLIGPNGAGKSTLFNCISGLLKADEGTVTFLDEDVTSLSSVKLVRRGLTRTFQISSVFPSLTAQENVSLALVKSSLGGRLGFVAPRQYRRHGSAELERLLELVGLSAEKWQAPAGSLSHGDARSLEVAMALACGPRLLCLDEPTAGMGVGESEYFGSMIATLSEKLPVLLVEHRVEMVLSLSHRVTVLAAGSVIADGSPRSIAASRAVRDAYLGVANTGKATS